nr:MAG TPA: hypothetical protein [Microviridae sp.]
MFNRADYYNDMYSVDSSILPRDSDIMAVPSPLDTDEIDALYPQDPSTGQLVDLLSQILQTENPLLRDSLMSKLETLPPTSSALQGVDDEIKLQLLKPRNMQSLSEMAEFTKFVSSALEQLNVNFDQVDPEPDPEPEPEPEPVSGS